MYRYSSSIRQNVEVLQAMATLQGKKTRQTVEHDTDVSVEDQQNPPHYSLSIKDHHLTRGGNVSVEKIPYEGRVYCLSVPSTYVLVRDGGIPVIAGQCVNFGYPGGLGWEKMIAYARTSYGVNFTETESKALKEKWYQKWPEMRLYHKDFGRLAVNGDFKIIQLVSGRHRGGCGYCSGLNSLFQGRTADGAKRAGFLIARECYLARPYPTVEEHLARGLKVDEQGAPLPSPLYGSRTCLFVHDEFVIEAPIDRAPKATRRLSEVMIMGMREYVADVNVKAEAVLCERWYKGAEPVYGPDGELVPWRPEVKAA
jgi:hypothetical protein